MNIFGKEVRKRGYLLPARFAAGGLVIGYWVFGNEQYGFHPLSVFRHPCLEIRNTVYEIREQRKSYGKMSIVVRENFQRN